MGDNCEAYSRHVNQCTFLYGTTMRLFFRTQSKKSFKFARACPPPDITYAFHGACQITRRMRDHGDLGLNLRTLCACARRASLPQPLGFHDHRLKRSTLCAWTHPLTSRRLLPGLRSTCPSRQVMHLSSLLPKGCATSGKAYLVLMLLARLWCSEHGRTKPRGPQLSVLGNDQSSTAQCSFSHSDMYML